VVEIRVSEIDIRVAMTRRRQVDQPPTCADKRRNPVNEDKVAKVIGAELCFKAIHRIAKRSGHYASIGDDDVEGFTLFQQLVGTVTHA
jgi:hypothetical protein